MARADLVLDIVKAGAEGNHELFRKTLEAFIAEEHAKQDNVLADQLAAHLRINGSAARPALILLESNGVCGGPPEVRAPQHGHHFQPGH